MGLAVRNVDRLDKAEREAIRSRARRLRADFGVGGVAG